MNIRTKIANTDRNNRDGSSRQDILSGLRPGDRLYLEDYASEQFPVAIGVETHAYKLCGFLGMNVAQEVLSLRVPLADIAVTVDDLFMEPNGLYTCVIRISSPTAAPRPANGPAPKAAPAKPAKKKARRKTVVWLLAIIAVLAALAVTLVVFLRRQPAPAPQPQDQQAFLDTASEEELLSYWAGLANATPPPKVVHTGSGAIGADYFVTIQDSAVRQTSDGLYLLEARIDWTNNAGKALAFNGNLTFTASQDGTPLRVIPTYGDPDRAIDGAYMAQMEDNQNTTLQPGATLEVIQFFQLGNASSPVEVEISDAVALHHNDSVARVFLLQ